MAETKRRIVVEEDKYAYVPQNPKIEVEKPKPSPVVTPDFKSKLSTILSAAPTLNINFTDRHIDEEFRPAYMKLLLKLRELAT